MVPLVPKLAETTPGTTFPVPIADKGASAATMFAASACLMLSSGTASAQDVIKVGAPLPLTGPLSPEGLKQKRGYDLWAEAANAKGGIKAGGKIYKVEIVYADYASNTPRAVQSAELMITENKVDALFAPFGSGATKAVPNRCPSHASTRPKSPGLTVFDR